MEHPNNLLVQRWNIPVELASHLLQDVLAFQERLMQLSTKINFLKSLSARTTRVVDEAKPVLIRATEGQGLNTVQVEELSRTLDILCICASAVRSALPSNDTDYQFFYNYTREPYWPARMEFNNIMAGDVTPKEGN